MKLDTILVCMKRTLLERFSRRKEFKELLSVHGKDSPAFRQVFSSHEHTLQARRLTLQTLKKQGLAYEVITRPEQVEEAAFDLAVVVGGDGTMLDYARFLHHIPLLGVNSSPHTSVGRFHYTDITGLAEVLDAIKHDRIIPIELVRLNVMVDGAQISFPALNEVLFAHKNPAATSRYTIIVGNQQETQRSSGVWVSTAAGSSGAILSAGGKLLKTGEAGMQYRVREDFKSPLDNTRHQLLGGTLNTGNIEFISQMFDGAVFLDGMRGMHDVTYWSRVTITPDGPKLAIFLRDK